MQVFTAHSRKFFAVTDRLTAAADTAAGAGHDFYEVIRYIAAPDSLEEFSGVAEATDNGGADRSSVKVEGCFCESIVLVDGTDVVKEIRVRIFAGQGVVSSTKRCFHDTAGCAEDDAGTGPLLHEAVRFAVRQHFRPDVGLAKHSGELSCGQYDVHILACVFFIVEIHVCLCLFCYARHNGYGNNIFRIHADGLGEVGLHDSAEHLLRGFRGGKLRNHLRELGLYKTQPARTAGGEHRPVV